VCLNLRVSKFNLCLLLTEVSNLILKSLNLFSQNILFIHFSSFCLIFTFFSHFWSQLNIFLNFIWNKFLEKNTERSALLLEPMSLSLKTEAVCSSDTLVSAYRSTRHYKTEDQHGPSMFSHFLSLVLSRLACSTNKSFEITAILL
jgi:hypothetical protein